MPYPSRLAARAALLSLCVATLVGAGVASAQRPESPNAALTHASVEANLPVRAKAPARPKVGLVLSGGGARGLAHVGVLKVLERERIPVDVIAGTSMGAIVGGLYASGLSATEVAEEVAELDWDNVFASRVDRRELSQRRKEHDFEVAPLLEVGIGSDGVKAPLGSLSSRVLEAHLRRLTLSASQTRHFDQLPTPFRAVATDMETGKAVILSEGDLATALRSSMSVPGLFAPLEVDGRILGDGGLVNNTPVDVAREMGAQRLIVVNIGTPLASRDTLGTLTGVTSQMINILTEQNVLQSLRSLTPRDVLIAPTLEGLSSADFDRAREFMARGEAQAEAMVLRMQDLQLSEAEYAEWKSARQRQVPASPQLDFVRTEGSKLTRPDLRADMFRSQPGDVFDVVKAERDINLLAASGDYLRTDYRLVRTPGGDQGLIFDLEDKPWGPNYLQMGLDFSADNRGRSAFNLKLVHNRHWLDGAGSEWRNVVRLGTSPLLNTEWYRPMSWQLPDGLSGFVAASAGTQRRTFDVYRDPDADADARNERGQTVLALEAGVNWRELGEWRFGWVEQIGRDQLSLVSGDYRLARAGESLNERWRESGLRLKGVFDQLDHAYFPTQGWRVEGVWFQGQGHDRQDSGYRDGYVRALDLQGQWVNTWGPHTVSVMGRMALSEGPQPTIGRFGLGGFQQLSGYAPYQVAGSQVGLLRLGYHAHLTDMMLTRGLFIGGSVEVGNAWQRPQDFWHGGKKTGFSLYLGADTAMGPVYTAISHSPGVGPTLMLFVGRP